MTGAWRRDQVVLEPGGFGCDGSSSKELGNDIDQDERAEVDGPRVVASDPEPF